MEQLKYMFIIIFGILLIVGAWYLAIILLVLFTAFYGSKILIFFKEAWNGSKDI